MPPNNIGIENSKKSNPTLFILTALAVIISGYFLISSLGTSNLPVTKENVVVGENLGSVPTGFPADIPIETNGVFEGARVDFPDRNIVQYSVSYRTDKGVEEKFLEYLSFISLNGYISTPETFSKDKSLPRDQFNSVYAKKGNSDISIIISRLNTQPQTTVQIIYKGSAI